LNIVFVSEKFQLNARPALVVSAYHAKTRDMPERVDERYFKAASCSELMYVRRHRLSALRATNIFVEHI
jgi:hypothetical protein